MSEASVSLVLDARRRREVWAFCYQMLGSPFDAEDAVQDVSERVSRARDRFDPSLGSPAAWTFRVARNVCLDRLRGAGRRVVPRDLQESGIDVGAPLVPRLDVPWLQPAPAGWAGGDEPGDAVVRRSQVRLALTAMLQSLPASQRAVLVLREILGYSAADTARALEMSVASVNSALQRARAALARTDRSRPAGREVEAARVEQFARALEAADAAALERLVTEDIVLEMPPVPDWSRGRVAYRAFMDHLFAWRGTRWRTMLTSANHQPALLLYLVGDDGPTPHTLQVFDTEADGRISHVLVHHDARLFALFETAEKKSA